MNGTENPTFTGDCPTDSPDDRYIKNYTNSVAVYEVGGGGSIRNGELKRLSSYTIDKVTITPETFVSELKINVPSETNVNTIEQPNRDKWGKDIEFLLSCIAMSVGLGNIWRFPYTAWQYGGGAFVIPYLIVLFLVGKPIYYLEMLMGQFSSRGGVKVFDFSPIMRGVGYGQVLSTAIVTTFYASVMGLTVRYFVASLNSELPWSYCKPEWENCVDSASNNAFGNYTNNTKTSAHLYFIKEVLKETDSIEDGIGLPDWRLFLCLAFAWILVATILIKGVRSSGKASYVLAIFPYIVLILLLIRSATLPGAIDGMIYFIKPNWKRILEAEVWYNAVTQVFFSLAICFGNIIMYASYNRFSHNIKRDAVIVTSLDTLTSLLAGFTIFGVMGHLKHKVNAAEISDVVKDGGAGLAFISYPEAIAKFEYLPQVFSALFFLMLFVLGIGSNVGMASCVMTVIRDRFPHLKHWVVAIIIATVGLSVGLIFTTPGGQFILVLLDFFGASFVAFFLAIAQLIAMAWIYGVDRLCKDIKFMLGFETGLYWRICWGFITPALMAFILIYYIATLKLITYQDIPYPTSVYGFGWFLSFIGLGQLPFWAAYAVYKQKGVTLKDKFFAACKPMANWGPLDITKLDEYKLFMAENEANKRFNTNTIYGKIKQNIFG